MMNRREHLAQAEIYLSRAAGMTDRPIREAEVELVKVMARLAEAHIKMAQQVG